MLGVAAAFPVVIDRVSRAYRLPHLVRGADETRGRVDLPHLCRMSGRGDCVNVKGMDAVAQRGDLDRSSSRIVSDRRSSQPSQAVSAATDLSAAGDPAFGRQLEALLTSDRAGKQDLFGLVVVNYGSSSLIAENLPAKVATDAGATVVIVDNFSTESEREQVRKLVADRQWELVASPTNEGFGGGVNAGVLRAAELGCRVCITVNPDARATADVLRELAEGVRRDPRQILSPIVLRPDGAPFFRGSTVNMRTGQIRAGWVSAADPEWRNWLSGACIAFSVDVFAELGGFAAEYFLYWEDVDLSVRAATRNIGLRVRDDLVVTHEEGGTHTNGPGGEGKSPLYYFYNTRNRLLFGSRLAPVRYRWSWLASTPQQSARIWLRGGRRQLFTQPKGVGAAVGGTIAGLLTYLRRRGNGGVVEDSRGG